MARKSAFTKGQEVTIIQNWDSKGTVCFSHAIVHSCGAKQMVLTDAKTGNELGRHFNPVRATEENAANLSYREGCELTFPRLSDDEVNRLGLIAAARIIVNETAHYESCLSRHSDSEAYCNGIRQDMALIHEPRVINRTGAR